MKKAENDQKRILARTLAVSETELVSGGARQEAKLEADTYSGASCEADDCG